MKRWHVLCPDAERTKAVYDALLEAGLDRGHIHIFARDHAALRAARLPEPTEMEEKMVAGEGIGKLISGMLGAAPPDPKIKEFEAEIDAGKVLLVIIFPKDQVDQIASLIERHPDARCPEAQAYQAR